MQRVKGFSYDDELDKDVIEQIEKQPHQANYIKGLVRADMYKKEGDDIEFLVKKYVEEILKDKKFKSYDEKSIELDSVMDLINLGR